MTTTLRPSTDSNLPEQAVAQYAWEDSFAVLYATREKCSMDQGRYVATLVSPMMGAMDVLDAVHFLLADTSLSEAVRLRFNTTL